MLADLKRLAVDARSAKKNNLILWAAITVVVVIVGILVVAHVMDKIALIRSMNSTTGAHGQGQYLFHTSYKPRNTMKHPFLGSKLYHPVCQVD